MNRSQPLVLILALLPCAALLAGCPDEKKADPADSSTAVTAPASATPAATPSASAVAVPITTPTPAAADAGSAADAGPAADAGKDAGKPAPKK